MKSKQISLMSDAAKELGVNPLTGEACAYGQRILCDVSERGRDLLGKFLGISTVPLPVEESWNQKVGEDDAIGSVMLTVSVLEELAVFALFEQGYYAVLFSTRHVVGVDREVLNRHQQEAPEELSKMNPRINLKLVFTSQPSEGDRNVHAATGRAV